jgi:Ser/Thr protein kinase RdoA (MazF antagonist)
MSLKDFLKQRYGLSGQVRALEGGLSHHVYLVEEANVVAKVYNPEISNSRLNAELEVLLILDSSSKISAPKPIKSLSGNFREPYGQTLISCFRKLPGSTQYQLTDPIEELEKIADFGEYLGLLHSEMNPDSSELNERNVGGVLFDYFKKLPGVDISEINSIEQKLFAAPMIRIHGDFQQSNILYLNNKISGILDFEYTSYDYRILDVVMSLGSLLSPTVEQGKRASITQTFLASYEKAKFKKLLPIEIDLVSPLLDLCWKLALSWVDEKLRSNPAENSIKSLRLYRSQIAAALESN